MDKIPNKIDKHFTKKVENALSVAGNKAQKALACQDDTGSQMAGGIIHAGELGYAGLKRTQVVVNAAKIRTGSVTATNAVKHTVKRHYTPVRGVVKVSQKAVEGVLTSSDDMMMQGTGHAVTLARKGIKTSVDTARATERVVKTAVKGTVKGSANAYKAIDFVRRKGWRAAWAKARSKIVTVAANAGSSVVSAAINLIKSLGSKVVVPLVLIVVVVSFCMSILAAPAAAVGGIFGGIFQKKVTDDKYEETNIMEYVADPEHGVPAKRAQYINALCYAMESLLKTNNGDFDLIRLKTSTRDDFIEPTIEGISSAFYTQEELVSIIQPIFNAIILKDYELSPSDAQAKQVLNDIFDNLFQYTGETSKEYCGQSAEDGSYIPATHACGALHAALSCPNSVSGIHTSYTCSICCYYRCDGHQGICTHIHTSACDNGCVHTHSPWRSTADSGCYTTTHCTGCIASCNGYKNCMGHDIITITFAMDGSSQLLYNYFEKPIAELESKVNRTEEEEDELSNLKDYYEICLEMINQASEEGD